MATGILQSVYPTLLLPSPYLCRPIFRGCVYLPHPLDSYPSLNSTRGAGEFANLIRGSDFELLLCVLLVVHSVFLVHCCVLPISCI